MGSMTNAQTEAFQDATGIRPATGKELDRLNRIQDLALELIRCAELEKSGICGGDGSWRSSDPLAHYADQLSDVVYGREDTPPADGDVFPFGGAA